MTRFVRLNPQLEDDPPSLDDVDRMQQIRTSVRRKMANDDRIPRLALQLVASCFYFEKLTVAEMQRDNSYEFKGRVAKSPLLIYPIDTHVGQIQCRFLAESEEIRELGRFLKEQRIAGRDLAFVIQEKYRGWQATSIKLDPLVIDRMIGQRRFNLGKITIKLSSKLAVSEIYFSVKDEGLFIISRFPRSLLEDEGIRESMKILENPYRIATFTTNHVHVIPRNPPNHELYIKTMGWENCESENSPAAMDTA